MRMTWALTAVVAIATAVTAVLHFAGAPALLTFVVATVALAGLAWLVSFATEQVGERFGPAITGLLQSTLGNLPEFFIVMFALAAGEIVVAQTSIIGSIFANALFVLGLVIIAGCHVSSDGVMRFQSRLPKDNATLMLLASFLIVVIGISVATGDKASTHITTISIVGAIVLLVTYGVWLFDYIRSDEKPDVVQAEPRISMTLALVLVAGDGAGRHPEGVRRARNRGDRRQRGREHDRNRACVEGRFRSGYLRGEELGRADHRVPLSRTSARLASLCDVADLRARARVHRRAGPDRDLALADHR